MSDTPKKRPVSDMGIQVSFSKLHTYRYEGDECVSVPLDQFDPKNYGHIHGELTIKTGGQAVPRLGFLGPDDVCFDMWIPEFQKMLATFSQCDDTAYVVDEYEQGQPAFEFRRDGETVFVSVIDSVGGGKGEPAFHRVACDYGVFVERVREFLQQFQAFVEGRHPEIWHLWLAERADKGPVT